MSSTNSSNRLALLSYALLTTTFLFTIIHEDSTSDTDRDDGSFSIISFSAKKLFQKGNLETTRDTYFVWSWHSRQMLVDWSLHVLGTLLIFSRTFP